MSGIGNLGITLNVTLIFLQGRIQIHLLINEMGWLNAGIQAFQMYAFNPILSLSLLRDY